MEFFPFPDKKSCFSELQRDIYFDKIPACDYEKIIQAAWLRGHTAACRYFSPAKRDIFQTIEQAELSIIRVREDHIIGSTRYFAEYYEKQKKIIVYEKSVELWCQQNQMSYSQGEELILAHEFFHYLECGELPSSKTLYQVPILRLGGRPLHYAPLRSVSEIGAHSFAHTYYRLLYL